eukprot:5416113-Amphidinium_carterae.1
MEVTPSKPALKPKLAPSLEGVLKKHKPLSPIPLKPSKEPLGKAWRKPFRPFQSDHRLPKGRHRDLEVRARNALPQACQLHWVKAHQTRQAVDEGRITFEDFQGNQEADEVANLGAAAHAAHEPTA